VGGDGELFEPSLRNDEMSVPRLYLAVSGCIFPSSNPDPAWGDVANAVVSIDHGNGQVTTEQVRWAPRLITALDSLLMQYGVELVWLSSWNRLDTTRQVLVPALNGLAGGRMLDAIFEPIDAHRTIDSGSAGSTKAAPVDHTRGLWKSQRIEEDQNIPAPFIWIDDVEVGLHGEELRCMTTDTASLLIPPRSDVGITVAEIDLMRSWLAHLA